MDALVAERAAQIAANSCATVAAIKDLYALAQSRLPMNKALIAALERNYPAITNTKERLAGLKT